MITISILNNKGGTGKTTSAVSIGSVLASKGLKVLLIDADEQCNLTKTLFTGDIRTTIYDSVKNKIDKLPIEQINENLYLVPASRKLNSLEAELLTTMGREKILAKLLSNYVDYFDYCIIDCPPAKNILTLNALIASKYALIPAEAAPYSYQGVITIIEFANEVKEHYNPSLEILGSFLTRSNARRVLTKDIKDALSADFNGMLFESDIRMDVSIPESQAARQAIMDYAPESNAAQDYIDLTEKILKKIKTIK